MCCQKTNGCGGGVVDPCAVSALDLIAPPPGMFPITPSDANPLNYNGRICAVHSLYVTATGVIALRDRYGMLNTVPVPAVPTTIPVQATWVLAQGTTIAAGNIFGLGVQVIA